MRKLALLLLLALSLRAQTWGPDVITVTKENVEARRQAMIHEIWGPEGWPTGRCLDVAVDNWALPDWAAFLGQYPGVDHASAFMYSMPVTVNGQPGSDPVWFFAIHLTPRHPNGDLFIYHAGHSAGAVSEVLWARSLGRVDVFKELTNAGYSVLAVSMPFYGGTGVPRLIDAQGGLAPLQVPYHNDFAARGADHPYKFYFEQIPVLLDHLGTANFHHVYMTGLSGGGWTTTLYAAMDLRVKASFPVAGSVPIWLRIGNEGLGDWEQTDGPVFTSFLVNYEELYAMATWRNRLHYQILNQFDDCCFYGTRQDAWLAPVTLTAQNLSDGRYRFLLDTTISYHGISPLAMARIIESARDYSETH